VTRTKTSTSTALASAETTTLPSSAKTSDADPGTGLSWAVNESFMISGLFALIIFSAPSKIVSVMDGVGERPTRKK
jgi:hypothetical protein